MAEAAVNYDVAIVGGGMAGASLALLLAHHLPDLRTVVIEKHGLDSDASQTLALPSYDDRTSALSTGTAGIFEAMGLWQALLPRVTPIRQVHVSDRGHPAGTLISASDHGINELGYVIENRVLGHTLLTALKAQAAITLMGNTRVETLLPRAGFAELSLLQTQETGVESVRPLRATLVVIADGADSVLRQRLGIETEQRAYAQHALIANVSTEHFHDFVAFERFTDEGPLALLPMADSEGQHRCALVWTNPAEQAEALMAMQDEAFLASLQARFGRRLGQFLRVGTRNSYPLSLVLALEQVRSNLVLLGNAAHTLHPVAGQSYNLAMRDAAILVDTLISARERGRGLGELSVLQAYLERQQWDQHKTIGASHLLTQLFSTRSLPASLVRNIGLMGLDLIPGVKAVFTRHAMGVAGSRRGDPW